MPRRPIMYPFVYWLKCAHSVLYGQLNDYSDLPLDDNVVRTKWTPMHYAAQSGALDAMKVLVELGGNPNARDLVRCRACCCGCCCLSCFDYPELLLISLIIVQWTELAYFDMLCVHSAFCFTAWSSGFLSSSAGIRMYDLVRYHACCCGCWCLHCFDCPELLSRLSLIIACDHFVSHSVVLRHFDTYSSFCFTARSRFFLTLIPILLPISVLSQELRSPLSIATLQGRSDCIEYLRGLPNIVRCFASLVRVRVGRISVMWTVRKAAA